MSATLPWRSDIGAQQEVKFLIVVVVVVFLSNTMNSANNKRKNKLGCPGCVASLFESGEVVGVWYDELSYPLPFLPSLLLTPLVTLRVRALDLCLFVCSRSPIIFSRPLFFFSFSSLTSIVTQHTRPTRSHSDSFFLAHSLSFFTQLAISPSACLLCSAVSAAFAKTQSIFQHSLDLFSLLFFSFSFSFFQLFVLLSFLFLSSSSSFSLPLPSPPDLCSFKNICPRHLVHQDLTVILSSMAQ